MNASDLSKHEVFGKFLMEKIGNKYGQMIAERGMAPGKTLAPRREALFHEALALLNRYSEVSKLYRDDTPIGVSDKATYEWISQAATWLAANCE